MAVSLDVVGRGAAASSGAFQFGDLSICLIFIRLYLSLSFIHIRRGVDGSFSRRGGEGSCGEQRFIYYIYIYYRERQRARD